MSINENKASNDKDVVLSKTEKNMDSEADISVKIDTMISEIENMSVGCISKLVSKMEEKFGVSAAAAVMSSAPSDSGEEAVAEKTEFNCHLVCLGDAKKVKVIQTIRSETSLGLSESKDLATNIPSVIKEGLSKEDAEKLKEKFATIGAKVEIK